MSRTNYLFFVKPRLVAGEQQIIEFVIEIWGFDNPIICIWETEKNPNNLFEEEDGKFLAIDTVKFYSKEHFHSLFFPNGFLKGEYNLVLAGIKDDGKMLIDIPSTGLVKGWVLGTDMEELTIDCDFSI